MNFLRFSRWSLRQKIAGMMVVCVLALGIPTFLVFRHVSAVAEAGKLGTFQSHAVGLSERISAQFYERYGDVQAFAANEAFKGGDLKKMDAAFNQYTKIYGIYDLILLVDPSGKYVSSNTIAPDGSPIAVDKIRERSFANEPWFIAATNGKYTEEKSKGFLGTFFEDAQIDKLVSEIYGRPMYGTAFTSQVKSDTGALLGVLTARPGFRWVEGEVMGLYRQLQTEGLGSTEITLLNAAGTLLVDYDPTTHGGSLEIKRDLDVIGKLNLADQGVAVARAVVAGKVGREFSTHARKKIVQAVGYTAIKSDKFIESIGWGVLVRTSRDELLADLTRAKVVFFAVLGICLLLTTIAALLFANRLGSSLAKIVSGLLAQGTNLASATGQIATASTDLSSSATEQAAALQETVSSLDEVSAMISKNAENAKRSQQASAMGHQAASRGKEAVDEMHTSIQEISSSNGEIMKQVEASNQEISHIVKVIAEIGNKTKVINDIVFQTKLLSFNASVEAARAGEHGKGFAVVAEEVGNLAQMSGNAAKEITAMLDDSIRKVEKTVNDTKIKVEQLMVTGRGKIEAGVVTSRKCGEALDQIVQNVDQLGQMVGEISAASQEQAQGVQEINRAMAQLDQVTQQNASASQEAANAAAQLNVQADSLRGIVRTLEKLVQGVGKTAQDDDEALLAQDTTGGAPPLAKVMPFKPKTVLKVAVSAGPESGDGREPLAANEKRG